MASDILGKGRESFEQKGAKDAKGGAGNLSRGWRGGWKRVQV
jgi:hypothetical protein